MAWVVEVPEEAAGARLDRVVAGLAGVSRRAIMQLIAAGKVTLNGHAATKGQTVQAGDRVEIAAELPTAENLRPVPEPDLPLVVVHADGAIVVVDKAAGVPSHPLKPGERGTLAGALVARFSGCSSASPDPREGGLAHRLDTDTSGLLVAARTRPAWDRLRAAFGTGAIEKQYLALVEGRPPERFSVEVPLAADPRDPRRVIVASGAAHRGRAQPAQTELSVAERIPGATLVRARAHTGHRHQVRVHLAHAGYPLIGDRLYGGPAPEVLVQLGLNRHLLHAARLDLPHPVSGERVVFETGVPDDFRIVMDAIWQQGGLTRR